MNDQTLSENTTDAVLGQEFLTWLWFHGETAPAGFKDSKGRPFLLTLGQKVVVQGGEGEMRETTAVNGGMTDGSHLPLREARLGLLMGKKVTRALLHLEQEELHWQVSIKADDFSMGSFRTPKIESDSDDDPEALFLEKMYVLEKGLALFDAAYNTFLALRLSNDDWAHEVHEIGLWMSRKE